MRRRIAATLVLLLIAGVGVWLAAADVAPSRVQDPSAPLAPPRPAAASAAPAVPEAAGTARVLWGEAVTSDDGTPVAGARVQAVLDNGAVQTTRTDAEGAFHFDDLSAPVAALRFHADGFVDVVVPRHSLPTLPEAFWSQRLTRVSVVPTGPADGAARIRGTVVDGGGTPVPAFHVAALILGGPGRKPTPVGDEVSDAAGRFTLDVPPGDAVLTVVADGFRPSSRMDLALDAGEVEEVHVVLARSNALHGHVLDAETRQPIAGARVALVGTRGMMPALTDGEGRFTLRSLPEENANLHVSAPGYIELNAGGVDGRRSRDQSIELALKPSQDPALAEVVGIGVAVGRHRDGVLVRTIYAGAPARDLLREGDVIVEVDGTVTADRSLHDNMGAIRGPEGTFVDLLVRGTDGATRSVRLERRRVSVPKG